MIYGTGQFASWQNLLSRGCDLINLEGLKENYVAQELTGCAYCHNYSRSNNSGLFDPVYNNILRDYPVYCKQDIRELAGIIASKLRDGKGLEVFNRFIRSRIRPSKKLLDNVRKVILNNIQYALLNE